MCTKTLAGETWYPVESGFNLFVSNQKEWKRTVRGETLEYQSVHLCAIVHRITRALDKQYEIWLGIEPYIMPTAEIHQAIAWNVLEYGIEVGYFDPELKEYAEDHNSELLYG